MIKACKYRLFLVLKLIFSYRFLFIVWLFLYLCCILRYIVRFADTQKAKLCYIKQLKK